MKKSLLLILGSFSAFVCCGYSAILSGTAVQTPATSVSLSDGSPIDWAIWNTTDSTAVASISATNTQFGGAGLISAITPFATTVVGGNTIRGVANASELFSYSDGTSPTSQTDAKLGFVINSTLSTAGRGVQVSVTGNSSQLYRVDVWTVGFAGQGELRANLNGADTVTLTSRVFGTDGSNKTSSLFSFFFTPDNNADLLSLSFHLMSSPTPGASAHVGIQAITVSAVPEPATYAMLVGIGGLALALVQRRRSV